MRRNRLVAIATASLVGAAMLPLTIGQVGATAAPATAPGAAQGENVARGDYLKPPAWKKRYDEVRKAAVEQRLRTGGKGVAEKLSRGVFGKVATAGTEKIFVVLAEFGDATHTSYPDEPNPATLPPGYVPASVFDGPEHNAIPKPNRKKDNSTLWQADYDRQHYQDMYFNRMRKFYENESAGRYSIDGTVTEWVRVPFNETRYGRDLCGGVACSNTWNLVRDALAFWVQDKLDSGWTLQQTTDYLKTFDELDRYDFDGDGNFKEPDGYIDHFQIVHSGQDAADGDPIYNDDAIWSHRWNAQIIPPNTGPEGGAQIGGVEVGMGAQDVPSTDGPVDIPDNPTGVWVNDYTIQPENGGLSVFAHEFAHDLELPDLYDTSGNQGGAENSVGFWSLMSQSRGTLPKDKGIGDQPMPMGAWDKFQLGWLDYDLFRSDDTGTTKVRPAQSKDTSSVAEAAVVLLPNKEVPLELGPPCETCGSSYFYSDAGNDLNNTMTVDVEGGGELTAKVNYEIEAEWDYAFLEASSDGGTTWTPVMTNLSDSEDHPGHNQSGFNNSGAGLTGTTNGWVDLTATVPDDANALRFRYQTDGAAVEPGLKVDNITLAGTEIGTAEADEGWTFGGFRRTTGSEELEFLNAYFVQNRQYVNLDKTLNHLYNFAGYADRPNWVDWFRNDPGALISYWDSSMTDNNVGDHPGSGLVLPVDAHPTFDHAPDGTLLRPRIATRDSAFSLTRTKKQTLHYGGVQYTLRGRAAQPLFDDMRDWWFDSDEHSSGEHEGHYQPGWYSVDVPNTGTTVRVVKVEKKSGVMTIRVGTSG